MKRISHAGWGALLGGFAAMLLGFGSKHYPFDAAAFGAAFGLACALLLTVDPAKLSKRATSRADETELLLAWGIAVCAIYAVAGEGAKAGWFVAPTLMAIASLATRRKAEPAVSRSSGPQS